MKERFINIKDNIEITYDLAKEFPKVTITLAVLIFALILGVYLRGEAWFECYKTAWYEQNVEFEKFDFKSLTGGCVVKRGDRWVPIDRVVDAGDISELE